MRLNNIFDTKNIVIGMVHFPPLLGYKDFPGIKKCLQKSMSDAKTLEIRKAVGKDFPILIGSGATKDNVATLLKYADGVIVGTALKTGKIRVKEVNLKPWQERISLKKTREFVKVVKALMI